jgi:hypothetical protein
MDAGIEARVIKEFGPVAGADIVALARSMMGRPGIPSPATDAVRPEAAPPREVVIPVTASDAAQAGGADLIRRTALAVARTDDPDVHAKAKEVIAALKSLAPRTAVEGGLAGLFVAMERAAFDCLAIARLAGLDTPMGAVMVARAEKLACRAIEAADAISRQRFRGQQTVRVEHVHIHEGANAVVGVVASGGRSG